MHWRPTSRKYHIFFLTAAFLLASECVAQQAVAADDPFTRSLSDIKVSCLDEFNANMAALQGPEKARAREALGYFKRHRFVAVLLRVVKEHPIDEIRALAAEDLAAMKVYRAISLLNQIFMERFKIQSQFKFGSVVPRTDDFSKSTSRIGDAVVSLQNDYVKVSRTSAVPLSKEEIEEIERDPRPMEELERESREWIAERRRSLSEDDLFREEKKEREEEERCWELGQHVTRRDLIVNEKARSGSAPKIKNEIQRIEAFEAEIKREASQ